MYSWWSLRTLYSLTRQVRVTIAVGDWVFVTVFVWHLMIYQMLINSLVCWFCISMLGLVPFQIMAACVGIFNVHRCRAYITQTVLAHKGSTQTPWNSSPFHPFSPSLMVFMDVKYKVYFLKLKASCSKTGLCTKTKSHTGKCSLHQYCICLLHLML